MSGLDFLVIGAQKSGTTTLWQLLSGHPQLAFPAGKEAPFFTDEEAFAAGLPAYLARMFPDAAPDALRGTVTPSYMKGAAGPGTRGIPVELVAERIADAVPGARLIALLREPIGRAISHHRMSARRGIEPRPLEQALGEQLAPGALAAARAHPTECNSYLVAGEYGRILAAYRERVPAERMLVAFTDELASDPDALLGRILAFLGVDAAWRPANLGERRMTGGDTERLAPEEAGPLLARLSTAVPDRLHGAIRLAFEEWNTIAAPAPEALGPRLRAALARHFAADGAALGELIGAPVPWAAAPPAPPRAPAVRRPEVSLLILAHDTPVEVQALLAGVVRHTDGPYEIVLIDNGSSPRGRDAHGELAERYGARMVALDANLTFSVANNLGAQATSGDELVFLNSDVLVTHRWLRNLRGALHSAADVGAVGPRTTFSRAAQGGVWLDAATEAGIDRFGRFFNHPDPGRWFELDWLAGFALLVRRAAFEAADGFDEAIPWHGLEDRALGQALAAAGWRSLCAGDTFVYHAGHRTFDATGHNRTASRFGRPAVRSDVTPAPADRLLSNPDGLVFEVRGGVAHHLEAPPGLIADGRSIDTAAAGELEGLPVGPPVSLYRAQGTNRVWLLHGGTRRPVRGDPDRIRRLPFVSMIDPKPLWPLEIGAPVAVEDAVPPVPKITARLPSNPATIAPEQLAGTTQVSAELRQALATGDGYALIRLGRPEALVLNHGMWPAPRIDRLASGVRHNPSAAAAALRQAIIGADAVGVQTDRDEAAGAPLLERTMFHYDLYPRLRCGPDVARELMAELPALLGDRRVALVCPTVLAGRAGRVARRAHQRELGFDVRLAVGLDDTRRVAFAFAELAARRESFDVVLVAAAVPGVLLCSRLARQLDVVALDLGRALAGVVRAPGDSALVGLAGEVAAYLRGRAFPLADPPHPLEGSLIRPRGEADVFYVERGEARQVVHPGLLALFEHEPAEVEPNLVLALPRGLPLCAVQGPLTAPCVLLDGRRVTVRLAMPVVAVEDPALAELPADERELSI